MNTVKCFLCVYTTLYVISVGALEMPKDELDKVIEDEITEKLSRDLLQSIEKKFQVDLEKSVDMVLMKIKMLLQNGTTHVQDKMIELQNLLETVRNEGKDQLDKCLDERANETSALAEKTLHQMVVCGYALIGHDPARAVTRVLGLKNMINDGVKPLYGEKKEIYTLLKVCGHDHENLKKVIKCVISKSTVIKSVMMDITSKLIEGVVDLTKLMAHGAMHEACLIEVVRTTEDEAFELIKKVRGCVIGTDAPEELIKYMAENNATVLDISKRHTKAKKNDIKTTKDENKNVTANIEVKNKSDEGINNMNSLLRRMLAENKAKEDKKKQRTDNKLMEKSNTDIDNAVNDILTV